MGVLSEIGRRKYVEQCGVKLAVKTGKTGMNGVEMLPSDLFISHMHQNPPVVVFSPLRLQ